MFEYSTKRVEYLVAPVTVFSFIDIYAWSAQSLHGSIHVRP